MITEEPSVAPSLPSSESQTSSDAARYLIWKKNAPHLYQTLATFALEWPSLSVQWIPEITRVPSSGKRSQALLLGTHTTGQAAEYVRLARLELPTIPSVASFEGYDPDSGVLGGYTPQTAAELRITQRIDHIGGINRVRAMPQNPNLVAAFSTTGQLSVYDITHYPNQPSGLAHPDISLEGHSVEGLALGWSPASHGLLASGDNEGQVLVWDVTKYDSHSGKASPQRSYHHENNCGVNAVDWHPKHPCTLASVGDDGYLRVVDTRDSRIPELTSTVLQRIPSTMSWNPVNVALMAVGFDDGGVELWDLRNTAVRVHSWTHAHSDAVTSVSWCPQFPTQLATASLDETVALWDASRFDESPQFRHGGHTAPVTDVAWNMAEPGMLASTAANNALHIWRPL